MDQSVQSNLERITAQLETMYERLGLASENTDKPLTRDIVLFAEQLYKLRRMRERHLPADLFAEPGWDILLDLFVADARNRMLSTSSVCVGAGVPATTALRWIAAMEVNGLIVRRPDPSDYRRQWLSLTPHATAKVRSCLSAMRNAL